MVRNSWWLVTGLVLIPLTVAHAKPYSIRVNWQYGEIENPVENQAEPVLYAVAEAGNHIYEVEMQCGPASGSGDSTLVDQQSRDEPILSIHITTFELDERGAPLRWETGQAARMMMLFTGGRPVIEPRWRVGEMKPEEFVMVRDGYSNVAVRSIQAHETVTLSSGVEANTLSQIVRAAHEGGVLAMSGFFGNEAWALPLDRNAHAWKSFVGACAPLRGAAAKSSAKTAD